MKLSLASIALCFLLVGGGASAQEMEGGGGGGNNVRRSDSPLNAAKVHTDLASMYFQDGKVAIALEELGSALIAYPKYAPAYSVAGLVHAFIRENDKAEALFKKALELAPNDPEINNNYGWFLCQTGKERQSIAYFLNAIKSPLYKTPDIAYTNAGRCALKAGDLEGAETYLKLAIRLSGEGSYMAQQQMAQLRYRQGNYDEARKLANEVLKATPQPSAEVLWLAFRAEKRMGNRSAEGALAAQLRSRHPDSPEYQNFLKGNFE